MTQNVNSEQSKECKQAFITTNQVNEITREEEKINMAVDKINMINARAQGAINVFHESLSCLLEELSKFKVE